MDPRKIPPAGAGSARGRGIILILAAGVVVLLLVVSLAFMGIARWLGLEAGVVLAHARARLAAASGMDYAARRLLDRPDPSWSAEAADRGDDWRFREGESAPLHGARNVSYAHGDGWLEGGAGDGRWTPGEAFADRDGDGAFSAASGRLRGGQGSPGLAFSLKVGALGGRIPVNAGRLDAAYARSLSYPYHAGLAHALNSLGAILIPAGGTRRADVPAGKPGVLDGEPIRVSWLGHDLIGRRPVGGYRDLGQVGEVLRACGYAAKEVADVLERLDPGPYAVPGDPGRAFWDDSVAAVPYVPVELSTASLEVLQALWMYVSGPFLDLPDDPVSKLAWGRPWTRSGAANVTFWGTDVQFRTSGIGAIFPDEAEALAREADAFRRSQPLCWMELRRTIAGKAHQLFWRDDRDLDRNLDGDADPATNRSLAQRAWLRAKADLACEAVAPDPSPWNPTPMPLQTGGIDFDPVLPKTQPFCARLPGFFGHVAFPAPYAFAYADPNAPYRWDSQELPFFFGVPMRWFSWIGNPYDLPMISPQGLTTAPPARFLVASEGGGAGDRARSAAAIQGEVRVSERIEISSQEDFERLVGAGTNLARMGVSVIPFSPAYAADQKRAWLVDPAGGRCYPHVSAYPILNPSRLAAVKLSRAYGGIALATREGGPQGAKLYCPLSEDLDGNPANDFWPEPSPVFPFGKLPAQSSYEGGSSLLSAPRPPGASPEWALWYSPSRIPCPSLYSADDPPPPIVEFSMEGWITPMPIRYVKPLSNTRAPDRSIYIGGAETAHEIELGARRVPGGTWFTFRMVWFFMPPSPSVDPLVPTNVAQVTHNVPPFFVPDVDPLSGDARPAAHHVAFTMKKAGGGRCDCCLYLDGELAPNGSWIYPPAPYKQDDSQSPGTLDMVAWRYTGLALDKADEMRFYDIELKPWQVADRFRLGRHVRPREPKASDPQDLLKTVPAAPPNPTYRSPFYRFERDVMLRSSQWEGITTPELSGTVGMRAVVFAYDAAGNPLGSVELPDAGKPVDLSGLGPVRSFSFAAEIFRAGGDPDAPLYATPAFESIRFALRRNEPVRWSAWGLR